MRIVAVQDAGQTNRAELLRAVGAALWSSFLAAAMTTMLFFATFDPVALYDDAAVLKEAFSSRPTGYALGFFFFWSSTIVASGLTLILLRRPKRDCGRGG